MLTVDYGTYMHIEAEGALLQLLCGLHTQQTLLCLDRD